MKTFSNTLFFLFTLSIIFTNTFGANVTISAQQNVSCNSGNDGSLTALGAGGPNPFTYVWSDGQTTATAVNLTAGTYTVTATANNGNSATTQATITEPVALGLTLTSTNVSCNSGNNGSVNTTVSGGTSPFTYAWNTGDITSSLSSLIAGTYTVTVTDANSCTVSSNVTISEPLALSLTVTETDETSIPANDGTATASVSGGTSPYTLVWNTAETSTTISNLSSGTYTVTVTDNNGCTASQNTIVNQPACTLNIDAITETSSISCNGGNDGAVSSTVSGGTSPYIYLWNEASTTSTISSLITGTYTLTVTDANTCTKSGNITLSEPSALSLTLSNISPSCNGGNNGTATVSASGGTSPYTYVWSETSTTATINNLTAGTYTVTVTDSKACTSSNNTTVSEPTLISATMSAGNASCNGGNDGSATVSASGGTSPYTYLWNESSTTATVNTLTAGTYTVTVTDANSCTKSNNVIVNEPTVLSLSMSNISPLCNGDNNGSASVTTSGGTSPYTYLWSEASTTSTINTLVAGTYTVTVTDSKSCTTSANTTLLDPATISITLTPTDPTCNGYTDGTINNTTSGGTIPYNYLWSNTNTTANISGMAPGTYTVTVTDANACTASQSSTLIDPAVIVTSVSSTNASCGANDGTVTVSVTSGGVPAFTYSWDCSPAQLTATATGLAVGIYNVTVTDSKGCTAINNMSVTNASGPSVTMSSTNVTCNGGSDGSETGTASGGTSPYTYLWSTGAITSTISGIPAGTYTITVTDAGTCQVSGSFTVSEPSAISISFSVTNISCNGGNDGSATLTASGGTSPYTYLWSEGSATTTIGPLITGTYTVTVTDANACTGSNNALVSEPSVLSLSMSNVSPSCNGGNNGTATVTASGGTSPYTYLWSEGSVTAIINNLTVGSYTVTVTDAKVCTSSNNTTISEPTVISAIMSAVNTSCNAGNDGSADVTASGGTSPYTYLWSEGSATSTVNNLTAGTYTVTVSDANTCTKSNNVTVSEPSALSLSTSNTPPACNGGTDGSASVTVSGGTSPYSYLWSEASATSTINSLIAGTYTVTVTDSKSCSASANTTLIEPATISITLTPTDPTCNGYADGIINNATSGGISPYSYLWSNTNTTANISGMAPGTYTVTVTDANACTASQSSTLINPAVIITSVSSTNASCGVNDGTVTVSVTSGGVLPFSYSWDCSPAQLTDVATGLAVGIYNVTLTDNNLCTATNSVSVSNVGGPSVTMSSTDVTCNGGSDGSGTGTASGGTSPYTYLWNTGAIISSISGLTPGTYTVTITDAGSCQVSGSITVSEPLAISISISTTNISCNGGNDGSATLTASGGTSPYTYLWSEGSVTTTISSLITGTYTVTVTDANACTGSSNTLVTEPSALILSMSNISPSCNGGNNGTATVSASGGTSPYNYLWSESSAIATINNLIAGTYIVTVTDSKTCTSSNNTTVSEPILISATMIAGNVSCIGGNDGSATVSASGGTSPYTYLWNESSSTATINTLIAGTYTVTVTDANSCTKSNNVIVNEPTTLSLSMSNTPPACNGDNNGSASVTTSGGTSPYTYLWSEASATATINTLIAGTYTVTVTDSKSCTASANTILIDPTTISITLIPTDPTCNGYSDGAINNTTSGGTSPYSYLWSNTNITANISGLSSGAYTVTVTDANGCTVSQSSTLSNPAVIVTSVSSTNASCGANDGTVTVSVTSGGVPAFSYSWDCSPAQLTATATGLAVGIYNVTVMDNNSCTATNSVSVSNAGGPSVTMSSTDVTCNGGSDGSGTGTVSGGTSPYTYVWNTGAITTSISGLTIGTYTVTITDAGSCQVSGLFTVSEPSALSISISLTNISCNGGNDGLAMLTASGGTSPYIYLWSDGSATTTIDSLISGTYTVTATDANACTASQSFTLSNPAVIVTSVSSTNASCGVNDGTVTVSVTSGGVPAFSYSWDCSPAQLTATATGLAVGIYNVTVTDNNLCTATNSVSVTNASGPSVTMTSTDVTCNGGSNGSGTATPSGGTSPYTYLWSTGAIISSISGLAPGTYTVTITDAVSCQVSGSFSVSEPSAISISISVTNISCNGGNDGSLSSTVSGGTSPYTYLWSEGSATPTINSLITGTYTVTVTDVNACTGSNNALVSEPSALSLSMSNVPPSCNGGNNGTATVSASGGTSPYTYLWSEGSVTATISNLIAGVYTVTVTDSKACTSSNNTTVSEPTIISASMSAGNVSCNGGNDGTASVTASGGTSPYTYLWNEGSSTATVNNLTIGTYTVTITDANSCTKSNNVTVSEPAALSLTMNNTSPSCNGGNDGTASVTVSGGTSPYTYLWSEASVTSTINTLIAGTYTVTVTDSKSCTTSANTTLIDPAIISITLTPTDPTCNGYTNGGINNATSGGTSPYSYLWSNTSITANIAGISSGTFTVTVTDANGCTASQASTLNNPAAIITSVSSTNATCGANDGTVTVSVTSGGVPAFSYLWDCSPAQITATATGLAVGIYNVTVTDNNSCTATNGVSVNNVGGPSVTMNSTDVTCNGGSDGSGTGTASGGTSPFTYLWNTGVTSSTISGLLAGTYTITITDAGTCQVSGSITVSEPSAISISISTNNISCNGGNDGSATLTASGGTSPYTYLWSEGSTTSTIGSLLSGTYTVTVTDANACTASQSSTLGNPAVIVTSVSSTNASCGVNDGTVTVSVTSGGIPAFSYSWDSSPAQLIATAIGLTVGIYNVTVTDNNSCTATNSVSVNNAGGPSVTINSTNISCNGGSDGSGVATVSGGTSPYTYIWSNGAGTSSISGLSPGTFTVTITDINSCAISDNFILTNPTLVTASLTSNNISCNGGNDGSASLLVNGGTSPYIYFWSGAQTTSTISNLVAGTYTVTSTDANNCSLSKSVTISQSALIASTLTSSDPICKNGANGTISLVVSGGTLPFTYLWSNSATNPDLFNLTAGTYSVTITDAKNCTKEISATLNNPSNGINYTFAKQDVDCYGNTTGYIILSATGGNAPYTYKWSNGKTSSGIANLRAGTYSFTITDAMNCPANDSINIAQPEEIIVDFSASDTNVIIMDSILFNNLSTGGNIYQWYFGDGDGSTYPSPTKAYNVVGIYSVTLTVMNSTGCSNSLVKKDFIQVNPLITGWSENTTNFSKLYPNPADNFININLPDFNNGQVHIFILDPLGRWLPLKKEYINTGNQELFLNISEFSRGIYFLRINTNVRSYFYRFTTLGTK